jgi:hypothetical protein
MAFGIDYEVPRRIGKIAIRVHSILAIRLDVKRPGALDVPFGWFE